MSDLIIGYDHILNMAIFELPGKDYVFCRYCQSIRLSSQPNVCDKCRMIIWMNKLQ